MSLQAETVTMSDAAVWLNVVEVLYFFPQVPRTLQMGCMPFTG